MKQFIKQILLLSSIVLAVFPKASADTPLGSEFSASVQLDRGVNHSQPSECLLFRRSPSIDGLLRNLIAEQDFSPTEIGFEMTRLALEKLPQNEEATSDTNAIQFMPVLILTNYSLHQTHPFFGVAEKSWNETSIRFGGSIQYKSFSAQVTGIGVKTLGKDPYGTNSKNPFFHLDLSYLQWNGGENLPLKITLGRQYIMLGSQFLIGDGIYDGFHPSFQQAVWHNPRRSFDALRVEFNIEKFHFDSFIYKVHRTWDAGGGEDGRFGGVDVTRHFEDIKGVYSLGLFYRYSKSNLDNDMALLNVRAEQQCKFIEGLKYTGELVWEFAGKAQNPYYVTEIGKKMNEYAWHFEANYDASNVTYAPFIEVGYVYYSKSFTPVATGFSDWGKWYLGNQIDWMIFGTNTKIIRAQIGCYPSEQTKLRLQYHNTRLVDGVKGTLSDEFSLIGEWYPNDWLWVNLLFGYSIPGDALSVSGLANPFSWINTDAVVVGNKKSFDVVLAFGINL